MCKALGLISTTENTNKLKGKLSDSKMATGVWLRPWTSMWPLVTIWATDVNITLARVGH